MEGALMITPQPAHATVYVTIQVGQSLPLLLLRMQMQMLMRCPKQQPSCGLCCMGCMYLAEAHCL